MPSMKLTWTSQRGGRSQNTVLQRMAITQHMVLMELKAKPSPLVPFAFERKEGAGEFKTVCLTSTQQL